MRALRVRIEQLPPGSAWHRASLDGNQWTNVEALLWIVYHQLQVLDQRLVWHKGSRKAKPKWPKWKRFPWAKSTVQIGDPTGSTEDERIAYLRSIGPGGDA